jgi:hypothetical protein
MVRFLYGGSFFRPPGVKTIRQERYRPAKATSTEMPIAYSKVLPIALA